MRLDVSTRYTVRGVLRCPYSFVQFTRGPITKRRRQVNAAISSPARPEKRVDTLSSFCYSRCSPFLWDSGPKSPLASQSAPATPKQCLREGELACARAAEEYMTVTSPTIKRAKLRLPAFLRHLAPALAAIFILAGCHGGGSSNGTLTIALVPATTTNVDASQVRAVHRHRFKRHHQFRRHLAGV